MLRGLAILIVFATALSSACSYYPCEPQHIDQALSPDGQASALLVAAGCGATVGDVTWVYIGDPERSFDQVNQRIAVFDGKAHRVEWRGSKEIYIYGELELHSLESTDYTVTVLPR
ncbi:MAG: hypothetical protein AAGH90_13055 [Pseudomonadota bacterium]